MKIILENLNDVEETDKQFFEETEDGKFQLNRAKLEESAKAGLLKKNKELLGKLKDAEKLSKFKDVDDETWTKFQEWRDSQGDDDDDDKSKGKPDEKAIRAQIKAEIAKVKGQYDLTIKQKDDAIAALERKFEERELDLALDALALEHGVIPKRLATWKSAVRSRFAREDGELVYLENGKAAVETTPEKAVKELLFKEFDYLYEAREAGGGSGKHKQGANNGQGAKTITRAAFDKLSQSDRDAKIKSGVSIVD
jgi:hypothetical protein